MGASGKEVHTLKEHFIPAAKLSKKARKELAKQKRAVWTVSPVTRKVESKKAYVRKGRIRPEEDGGEA